ncbi:unnamed protein product, partial [Didymodactylos carnosus]
SYKIQLDNCQETIAQLRKTIDVMEKRLDQLPLSLGKLRQKMSSDGEENQE